MTAPKDTDNTTRIDWFATPNAPNVIDAEPIDEPSPWGAGRHRLGSRPGMTHVWALTGIRPRRRRLSAPRARLALLPAAGGAR